MKKPKTKYKNIYPYISQGKYIFWCAKISLNGVKRRKYHKNEKDAAKWVDLQLILHNKKPINGFYTKK